MKKILALTLVSAFLFAGIVVAQPGHGHKNFKKGKKPNGIGMILQMADKLELTVKQKDQLESMAVDFKIELIDLKAEIKKEEVLLKSLMRDDNASERDVFAKIDKIAALKADSKKMKFSQKNAVNDILTDDQIETLKEFRKNHKFAGKGHGQQCDQKECDGHGKNLEAGHGQFGGGKGHFKKN